MINYTVFIHFSETLLVGSHSIKVDKCCNKSHNIKTHMLRYRYLSDKLVQFILFYNKNISHFHEVSFQL